VECEADIEQALVFHSLPAQWRAELCDLLDEQAIKRLALRLATSIA
jgi:hypothetical protein